MSVNGDLALINRRVRVKPSPHAETHEKGGADEVALDASQIVSGVLAEDRIPHELTNPLSFVNDSPEVDFITTQNNRLKLGLGYHGSQWAGRIVVPNNMGIQLVSGSTELLYIYPESNSPHAVAVWGDLVVGGNNIRDGGWNVRVTLGSVVRVLASLEVTGNLWMTGGAVKSTDEDAVRIEFASPTSSSSNPAPETPRIRFVPHQYVDNADTSVNIDIRGRFADLEILFNGTKKFYFRSDGYAYADGGWSTFSPSTPDDLDTLVDLLQREAFKPEAPKTESGESYDPETGKTLSEMDPSELEAFREKYGKDISLIAIAAGKALVHLYDRVRELESEVAQLRAELEELKSRLGEG